MYTPIDIRRSSHYGSNYWETYSPKLKRIVKAFSDLEYDNYVLVETNPKIKSFCEQPIRIKCFWEGNLVESIFDMWIKWDDEKEEFIEVKYLSELDPVNPKSDRSIRQTNVQRRWCADHRHNYRIQTEREIRDNSIFLANMKVVLSYVKKRLMPIETDIMNICKIIQQKKYTIGEIINIIPELDEERIFESISWMIYQGKIFSNVEKIPLSVKTEVWANAE